MPNPAQRVLSKVLFRANEPDPNRPEPRPVDGTSVFFRVRLTEQHSADDVQRALTPLLTPSAETRKKLGATQVYLYSDASHRGREVTPFLLGRTHTALTLFSKIAGRPVPPKFSTEIPPAPAALLEIQFDSRPTGDQREVLAKIEHALAPAADEVSSIECDHRYIVVDHQASGPEAVFLTVLTRVPWNRSIEQAQHYWINDHAALVHDNLSRMNMTGYVQVHTTTDPDSSYDNEFSGVATIEFDSLADYQRQGLRPAAMGFNNTLCLDEMNLTIDSEVYLFHRESLLSETDS